MLKILAKQLHTHLNQTIPELLPYPDVYSLTNSEAQLKEADCLNEHYSFFYIFNELLKLHCKKNFPTLNYRPIHNFLKNIWENQNVSKMDTKPLDAYSCQEHSAQDLISLIITARYQTIINLKKRDSLKKENILLYYKESQQRINFMIKILDILHKELHFITTLQTRSSFLNIIFSDLNNQLERTSMALFFFLYNIYHKELVSYAHNAIQTKICFSTKVEKYLKKNTPLFNIKGMAFLLRNAMCWSINCARFYYIMGQDVLANSYMTSYSESFEDFKSMTNDSFPKYVFDSLSESFNQIEWSLKNIPLIKIYTSLIPCIKHTGDIVPPLVVLEDLNLIDILETLKNHSILDFESLPIMQKAIASLGLAYQNRYDNNLKKIKICKKIAARLSFIFSKNSYNVMATYMQCIIFLHIKKIEIIEKNINEYLSNNNENLKNQLSEAIQKAHALNKEKTELTKNRTNRPTANEILENQEAKIKRLKTKIETLRKKDSLLQALAPENQNLLQTLKNKNIALLKKKLILNQKSVLEQEKLNEFTQKEAVFKFKIDHLKKQKEKLHQKIQSIQHQLKTTPNEIVELQRKKEKLVHQNKIKNLQKKIKKLQSKHIPLVHSKAQVESSIDSAHQTTLAVNAANHADNQEFPKILSGFIQILEMFKSNLEFQHATQNTITTPQPGVFYSTPSVDPCKPMIQTPQSNKTFASEKRNAHA